jgi:hypothetical protein
LPTPQEWLFAARGSDIRPFAWGSTAPSVDGGGSASPFGVEDVLRTSRELLRGAKDSPEPACADPSGYCVAASLVTPEQIDMMWSIPPEATPDAAVGENAFGFRCVWEVP